MESTRQIDWQKIRTEYITTKRSYRDLAAEYGMSRRTLEIRARKENWPLLRKEYDGSVTARAVAKCEKETALATADTMATIKTAINRIAKLVDKAIEREAEADAPNVYRVYKLAATIKCLAEAHRNAFDIPTFSERQQAEIAAERLRIESAKAEQDKNALQEVRLSFDGGSDPEWAK